ncbi:MAG: putative metal-binding motif-containing protein, partial [Myxococcota bacterium]|nr:putative metal-binding motif-containing protein [Myxococcota bacterium]
WYADADGDGYGDPGDAVPSCDPVDERTLDSSDCDDTDPGISPDASEVCDETDNDCDGDIDDADATLDPATRSTWYADPDGDGYGADGATTRACAQPSGFVDNADDCDDTEGGVNPSATEVCDEVDNDCDGATDDADETLDLTTASTFFADLDGDGYGDPSNTVAACVQPTGYLADDQDCEDGDATINPAATEVCDDADNDCDGDIDDADSSLDLSTAATWYEDGDSDGLGNAAVTDAACEQPSGYVANDADCDDGDPTDAGDLDGDGDPDCSDVDIDGDGLRNGWDVEPEDDTVARGPTEGLGGDGAATFSGTDEQTDWTVASAGIAAGATTLGVDDASRFASGDEVLVLSQMGADAGQHQFVYVAAATATSLTVEPPVTDAYDTASVVLVQRVPHYTSVDVSGTLDATPWDGAGGGVVVFRATGPVSISGQVEAQGAGFLGGEGVSGNGTAGSQGDSFGAFGSAGTASANDGGGGSYPLSSNGCDGGGGGGHGTAGSIGYGLYCASYAWWGCATFGLYGVTNGGSDYGAADLTAWHL